jgi:hypothetical protein
MSGYLVETSKELSIAQAGVARDNRRASGQPMNWFDMRSRRLRAMMFFSCELMVRSSNAGGSDEIV